MSLRTLVASVFLALHLLGVLALVALNRIPPAGMGWFMTSFGATMAIHVTPADIVTFDTQGLPVQPLATPRAEVVLMTGRYIQQILVPLPSWLLLISTVLCIGVSAAVFWVGRRRV